MPAASRLPTARPAERYGATPPPLRRRAFRTAVGIGCAALLVLVVWSSWHHANPPVRTGLLGFAVLDDARVEVHFEVAADPSAALQCDLRAQNFNRDTVGSAVVDVPPGPERREVRAIVRTRTRAVAGQLQTCRLVGG